MEGLLRSLPGQQNTSVYRKTCTGKQRSTAAVGPVHAALFIYLRCQSLMSVWQYVKCALREQDEHWSLWCVFSFIILTWFKCNLTLGSRKSVKSYQRLHLLMWQNNLSGFFGIFSLLFFLIVLCAACAKLPNLAWITLSLASRFIGWRELLPVGLHCFAKVYNCEAQRQTCPGIGNIIQTRLLQRVPFHQFIPLFGTVLWEGLRCFHRWCENREERHSIS